MATNVERPLEWMRFDPVKFAHLVDELSRAQVGTVMKLILRIWEFGPMTEASVRTVANGDFEAIRVRMFEVDGLLSFEMVEDARAHGKRRVSQRIEAGQASAAKRKEQATTVERPLNDRSADVLSNSLSSSDSNTQGKERASKFLFANCKLNDPDAVKAALPELVSEGVNLEHYRKAILNWSDTKNELRTERGWLATFRQWTDKDREKKELKMAKPVWNPRA